MRSTFRSLKAALLACSVSMSLSGVAHAEDKAGSWTDNFTLGAYVDAYGALRSDSNRRRLPVVDGSKVYGSNVPNGTNAGPQVTNGWDAYVQNSGFTLASAGLDAAYSGEKFGATISLRFGPSVNRFYAQDQSPFGIENILQAYATWKPFSKLTLDMGQFYTIYGAEVFESWRNMNYSRGALYYSMQPFWHTGLRANLAVTDKLAINALLVNGVNTAYEGNKSPSLGLQVVATPTDELFFAVGWLGGLTPRDGDDEALATKNFQDFFDFVGTGTFGDFKVVLNADLNLYKVKGSGDLENWWGVSVAPGYSFTNWFGAAARVEYLSDSANSQLIQGYVTGAPVAGKTHLTTLTGTLDFKPVPNSSALVIRPEFRYELASDDSYKNWDGDPEKKFWSLALGAVVTSM
ncbi:MAG: outer membrane beta-barrel protein [Myxococcales bacterium]